MDKNQKESTSYQTGGIFYFEDQNIRKNIQIKSVR